MSKELIENLRLMAFESLDNDEATMLREAADAIEANAAPVGERDAYEAWKLSMKPYGFDGFDAYQAGAAHQRQQARELLQDLLDLAVDAVEHHRLAYAGYKQERQARMDSTIAEAIALLANDEG